jgi:hypothetical protein
MGKEIKSSSETHFFATNNMPIQSIIGRRPENTINHVTLPKVPVVIKRNSFKKTPPSAKNTPLPPRLD